MFTTNLSSAETFLSQVEGLFAAADQHAELVDPTAAGAGNRIQALSKK
jgi:hypothetical protein